MYTINVNCETGEVTRHEMTPEEVAEWEADCAASQLQESKQEGIEALEDFRQKAEIQRVAKAAVGLPVIPNEEQFNLIMISGIQKVQNADSINEVTLAVQETEQAASGS